MHCISTSQEHEKLQARYSSSVRTMASATDISSTNEYMSRPSTQLNWDMLAGAQPRTNAARKKETSTWMLCEYECAEKYNKYVRWIDESGEHVTDVMDDRPCVRTTQVI